MRSISTKLILAFMSIGIISVAVIFITARWNTRVEFIRFLSDQTQTDITTELSEYFRTNGSWDGADIVFIQSVPPQQPGFGPGPGSNLMMPFTLTDENGNVIISNERYKTGDKVPEADLALGISITEDRKVIGVLVPMRIPFQGNPRELEFIKRTNLSLIYSALIGAGIALLLGMFLSRTLTHPIRELTQATYAVSEGNLSQQVPIRSKDELGELARAFNKMSAELSRSVNARRQMTADIAHELRTPLSLILGHAEAVHDGVLPASKENFEIIREEAERLEQLVNDLRILSLADAGELSMELQQVDLNKLIGELQSHYLYQFNQKRITWALKPAPRIAKTSLDPVRISQVLTNVLDNALHYTPEGGHVEAELKQVEDYIQIAIQDNGPGVTNEEATHLFDRFYRADPSRAREDGGSGLGLTIAKSIIEMHNGKIWAESKKDNGLKVVIQLPLL